MILRELGRKPTEPVEGVLRLVLSAALLLTGFGMFMAMDSYFVELPDWATIAAALLGLAIALLALWQFVLALFERAARSLMFSVLLVAGIVVISSMILKALSGYLSVLLTFGVVWLEIIRRTWPPSAIRGPDLRSANCEPPERSRMP